MTESMDNQRATDEVVRARLAICGKCRKLKDGVCMGLPCKPQPIDELVRRKAAICPRRIWSVHPGLENAEALREFLQVRRAQHEAGRPGESHSVTWVEHPPMTPPVSRTPGVPAPRIPARSLRGMTIAVPAQTGPRNNEDKPHE